MKKILFILPVLILLFSCFAQNKKKNTNSGLPVNTAFLNINPQPFITSLPRVLNETSGLIFYKGLLWTINDSGGKNVVYGFDFNGEIQHEIEIKDAKNNDWEEIAQDEKHIYIGDFGNNNGMRKDLKIYKIKKKDIGKKATKSSSQTF